MLSLAVILLYVLIDNFRSFFYLLSAFAVNPKLYSINAVLYLPVRTRPCVQHSGGGKFTSFPLQHLHQTAEGRVAGDLHCKGRRHCTRQQQCSAQVDTRKSGSRRGDNNSAFGKFHSSTYYLEWLMEVLSNETPFNL